MNRDEEREYTFDFENVSTTVRRKPILAKSKVSTMNLHGGFGGVCVYMCMQIGRCE